MQDRGVWKGAGTLEANGGSHPAQKAIFKLDFED